MNTGGQYFCANTQFKNSKDSMGVEPPNRHYGYASWFHLVHTTKDLGSN